MLAPVELVIEGGPRPHVGQSFRELWAFRGTILAFAERDYRLKYKQAVLGVAWAVIQPLAFMAIFTACATASFRPTWHVVSRTTAAA